MPSVLVVDDDVSIRRLVKLILTDAGFDVTVAEDGREALAILQVEAPSVLVLDMNMPVMDGRELFERLEMVRATRKQGSEKKRGSSPRLRLGLVAIETKCINGLGGTGEMISRTHRLDVSIETTCSAGRC